MSKNPALYFYLIAAFFFLLAIFFRNEEFLLVTKPIIIPSIMFHYYIVSKDKINGFFVFSLVLFFVGDMLFLINFDDFYIIGLLIFLLPYLFVLYFLFQDLRQIIANRKNRKIDYTFIIIFLILVNLFVTVLINLDSKSIIEKLFLLLFGIALVILGVLATVIYFHSSIKRNFYLVITISTFIMSDLFFIINKNVQNLLVFELINGFFKPHRITFMLRIFFTEILKNNSSSFSVVLLLI